MSSLSEHAAPPQSRPVATLPAPRTRHVRLPNPLTRLIGREREIAAIAARVQQPGVRLITLSGPPGVGKTRLAVAAAKRLASSFPDGVHYVPLASINNPTLVPMAIAQELGVRETPGATIERALRDELASRAVLIVLDNFEQLLPAGSVIVDLLTHCADLTLLVTSRTTLHLR